MTETTGRQHRIDSAKQNRAATPPPTRTTAPNGEPSGYLDAFCIDNLPPRDLWPTTDWTGVPELNYPRRLNCASTFLDDMVQAGHGERPAVRWPEGIWNYRDLLAKANQIAHVLRDDMGLVPGNRVLLRAPNTPMQAACWFGILKAGGVVVCTMPLLRERELVYILDKAKVAFALTDARFFDDCNTAMQRAEYGNLAHTLCFQTDAEDGLDALMCNKPTEFTNCDTSADDIAIIAFTSGTTGRGKGTMHSHRDILAITDCFARYILRPTTDDVFCGSPPLAFTYALGGLLLFPLRFGASTLLLEKANPPLLVQAIHEHRPTICFTAPTAYRAMCGMLTDYDVSSLVKCVSAGETLPYSVFESWQAATGLKIIDGIGATEMLHIFISASGDEIRPGATGKAVPGYQARVVDDDGNEVPVGEIGNLAVHGPTGCRYLADIERQQEYVKHGWNITGDSYKMDADGYFWYQARTDDMIVSSGYNISAPEVENVLLEHACVQECGVIGIPHEERGQIIKGVIVLRSGFTASNELIKELQDFVKARIAPYKYPRAIEFVDALPRTTTGKLQRFRLRTQ